MNESQICQQIQVKLQNTIKTKTSNKMLKIKNKKFENQNIKSTYF